ncbi:hypothetical protein PINS_up022003 [Pythium insidiosum]|nr:hypothetical protein PINS_up022003 [Pythium insidiosum]
MGNKHGKPRGSSGPISGSSKGNTSPMRSVIMPPPPQAAPAHSAAAPPAAPTAAAAPSSSGAARPIRINPILESKLSSLDVTAVFSPQEIQAIRVHLSSLLGVHESEPIVIRKEEFYRFLGTSTSSLYVNRLYAIFDMAGKGTVDFDDLMRGLAILSQKASREQKLLLSFHLLDADGHGLHHEADDHGSPAVVLGGVQRGRHLSVGRPNRQDRRDDV